MASYFSKVVNFNCFNRVVESPYTVIVPFSHARFFGSVYGCLLVRQRQ